MKMTLSLTKLSQLLLKNDPEFALVRYINELQGFSLAHLDFGAAAERIGVSPRTVGRIVKRLAEGKILIIERNMLRINKELAAT